NLEAKRIEILALLCNDLDSPRALQLLRNVEKDPAVTRKELASLLVAIEPLLGLGLTQAPRERSLSAEDATLLEERSEARARRDFAESDRLRTLLAKRGIEVRDKPDGLEWEWR
ncbi:MAG: cysteine--tRNA ligase, partial [bacterium]